MTTELYTQGTYAEANPTWHAEDSAWKAEQILRVASFAPSDRPVRICDVGCGTGGVLAALGNRLAARGIRTELTGFDIAPIAIERARNQWPNAPHLSFECRDVLTLDRLDFDWCLLMDVLEHLEDPVGFLQALRTRGLRAFIIHLPLENNWLAIMRGRTDPRSSPVGHLHFFDTHSGLSLVERAGLAVRRWVYTPEIDLDIRCHRTLGSVLAYMPRKAIYRLSPTLAVHTLGGSAMMIHGEANP